MPDEFFLKHSRDMLAEWQAYLSPECDILRSWLDETGAPMKVQQELMRHVPRSRPR